MVTSDFRLVAAVLVLASWLSYPGTVSGQGRPSKHSAMPQVIDAEPSINRLLTGLVLKHLPHTYTRDKGWGAQTERWDGIDFRRDGWRLETKRKKKLVNHGTWRRYTAELVDPNNQFAVSVSNIRQAPSKKLAFDVNFGSQLKLHARQSKWVKGVQLYSVSAEGRAQVRLTVKAELDILLDPTKLPPDLVFKPHATSADLTVVDFRIDRVSKLGGEFAQQVTRMTRSVLDEQVDKKEQKLVDKLNQAFEKDAEKLRISPSELIKSQWTSESLPFVAPSVRAALDIADQ